MRFWNECKGKNETATLFSSFVLAVFGIGVTLSILSALFSSNLSQIIFNNSKYNFILTLGIFQSLLQALISIPLVSLRMEKRILEYNLLQIVQIVFYFVIAYFFIFQIEPSIDGVAIALLLSFIPMLLIGFILQKHLLTLKLNKNILFAGLKYGLPLMPAVMMTWFNTEIDKILLIKFSTIDAVGIFAVAEKFSGLIILIISIFSLAWTPISLEIINFNKNDRDRFYKKIFSLYSLMLFGIATLFFLFIPFLLDSLFNDIYSKSLYIIPWLIGAYIFKGASSITGIGVLISKKTFFNSIVSVFGGMINLIVGIWAIPRYGLLGAAVGMFFSQFFIMLAQSILSQRLVGIKFNFLPIIFSAIIFFIISHLVLTIQ
jgi:O-antigen/teichoic acid export membrane protein